MKSFFQNNNIEILSVHNEGKSVVAERFITTLILFRMGLFGLAHG